MAFAVFSSLAMEIVTMPKFHCSVGLNRICGILLPEYGFVFNKRGSNLVA